MEMKTKILVHFVLCQKSLMDYKDIEKGTKPGTDR